MPRKIEKQEICDRLLQYATQRLDTKEFLEDGSCRIRYANFREAMMETDLIVSEPTIRSKWKMLAASGIIAIAPGDRTGTMGSIEWGPLKQASRPSLVAICELEFETEKEKNKKTKKHTEEAFA